MLLALAPLALAGLLGAYVGWRLAPYVGAQPRRSGSRRGAVLIGAAAGVVVALVAYAVIAVRLMA